MSLHNMQWETGWDNMRRKCNTSQKNISIFTFVFKALKSIVKAQLMEHDAIYVQSLAYCC